MCRRPRWMPTSGKGYPANFPRSSRYISCPKRLKKAQSRFLIPDLSSVSSRPRALNSRIACGSSVMPTPSSLISGARSYTRQAMPRSFRLRASESPQMPPPTIATSIQLGQSAVAALQRFDFHFAEFDRTGSVLQHDRTFVEHAIAQLCRCLAIEHNRDVPAIGGDFIGVPLAAGFRHWIDLDIARDRTCAIAWVGALVENICFVARPVGDLLGIEAAEVYAAVGIVAWKELDAHDEILVRIFADQVAGVLARHLVNDDRTILDTPV